MEYFVYDGGTLVDIVKLNNNQVDTFVAENPTFRIELCEEIIFEEDDYEEEDY